MYFIWLVVLCMHSICCCGLVPPGMMTVLVIALIIAGFLYCLTTLRLGGGYI